MQRVPPSTDVPPANPAAGATAGPTAPGESVFGANQDVQNLVQAHLVQQLIGSLGGQNATTTTVYFVAKFLIFL